MGKNKKLFRKPAQPSPSVSSTRGIIRSLFEQAERHSVTNPSERSSEESVNKIVTLLDSIFREALKDPSNDNIQRYAIRSVLSIQTSTKFTPAICKKIVSIFFIFLLDEFQRHWNEYDIDAEDVHPDIRNKLVVDQKNPYGPCSWHIEDISHAEYLARERALTYMSSTI
ncbi:uncharacterized protein LOC126325831 [Schistocerca gregaria]|uniref:uncharacterized protein LOC126325831 n=1 Tax=Schistocerca gregaria TaxID=7010 RepID=UPI00211E8F72|nr:uncharacterized protein LOC126325831 [Schistocerca gregaria]